MKFTTLSAITIFGASVAADCVSKVNIDTCETQYRSAIDKRCGGSANPSACYCTDLPSLAACYDFCINESVYQDRKRRVIDEMANHCTRANLPAAVSNPKPATPTSSVTNVALFASGTASSSASASAQSKAASSSASASASAAASSAAASAKASASSSAAKSSKSSNESSGSLNTSNTLTSIVYITLGSFASYILSA